jgi:hypothetical protein
MPKAAVKSAALRWTMPGRKGLRHRPASAEESKGWTRSDPLQARLKTSVPFVPPNPNEFFSAMSIFISRAVFAQ